MSGEEPTEHSIFGVPQMKYFKISHQPRDMDFPGAQANDFKCGNCGLTFGHGAHADGTPPTCPRCGEWDRVKVHSVRVPWDVVEQVLGAALYRRDRWENKE